MTKGNSIYFVITHCLDHLYKLYILYSIYSEYYLFSFSFDLPINMISYQYDIVTIIIHLNCD